MRDPNRIRTSRSPGIGIVTSARSIQYHFKHLLLPLIRLLDQAPSRESKESIYLLV